MRKISNSELWQKFCGVIFKRNNRVSDRQRFAANAAYANKRKRAHKQNR